MSSPRFRWRRIRATGTLATIIATIAPMTAANAGRSSPSSGSNQSFPITYSRAINSTKVISGLSPRGIRKPGRGLDGEKELSRSSFTLLGRQSARASAALSCSRPRAALLGRHAFGSFFVAGVPRPSTDGSRFSGAPMRLDYHQRFASRHGPALLRNRFSFCLLVTRHSSLPVEVHACPLRHFRRCSSLRSAVG